MMSITRCLRVATWATVTQALNHKSKAEDILRLILQAV